MGSEAAAVDSAEAEETAVVETGWAADSAAEATALVETGWAADSADEVATVERPAAGERGR